MEGEHEDKEAKEFKKLAKRMKVNLKEGWKIGFEETDKELNQKTYEDDFLGTGALVETAKQLIEQLNDGEIVPFAEEEAEGFIPLFAAFKNKWDETKGYRIIRNGSEGSATNPSINELTPDSEATIKLPLFKDLVRNMYIFWRLYGTQFTLAKRDLKSAFRILYLEKTQVPKICYRFNGKVMADTRDIWGTRSGSKHTQDVGKLADRFLMLLLNGKEKRKFINKAVEERDMDYFMDMIKQKKRNGKTQKRLMEEEDVLRWEREAIIRWLEKERLSEYHEIILENVTNGEQLMKTQNVKMKKEWKENADGEKEILLKDEDFWKALNGLKQRTIGVKLLIECYVDDHMYFIAPNVHEEVMRVNEKYMEVIGLRESKKKRIDGKAIDMTGWDWSVEQFKVKMMEKKRSFILQKLKIMEKVGFMEFVKFESLLGKMQHGAVIIWPGLAFLRRLQNKKNEHLKKYGRRRGTYVIFTKDEIKDIRWWIKYMQTTDGVSILSLIPEEYEEREMFFDAATNGSRRSKTKKWRPALGAFFEGNWTYGEIPSKYLKVFKCGTMEYEKEYAIPHFEMIAVIAGLKTFEGKLKRGWRILLRTDNTTVEAALKKKSAKDEFMQACIRWITMRMVKKGLRYKVMRIPSKDNKEADELSRLNVKAFKEWARPLCKYEGWEFNEEQTKLKIPNVHMW